MQGRAITFNSINREQEDEISRENRENSIEAAADPRESCGEISEEQLLGQEVSPEENSYTLSRNPRKIPHTKKSPP